MSPWMLNDDAWQPAALIALAGGCRSDLSSPVRQALLAIALTWLAVPTTDLETDQPDVGTPSMPDDPFASYLGRAEAWAAHADAEPAMGRPREADAISLCAALLEASAGDRGDPVPWWVCLTVALRQQPHVIGRILAATSERTRRRIAIWTAREPDVQQALLDQQPLTAAQAATILGYKHARSVYDLRGVWPDIFLPGTGRAVRLDPQRLLARLRAGRPPSPSRQRHRQAGGAATTAAGRPRGDRRRE